MVAGWAHSRDGISGVLIAALILTVFWFFAFASMKKPPHNSTKILAYDPKTSDHCELIAQLRQENGIIEVLPQPKQGLIYIKVDKRHLDTATWRRYETDLGPSTI